MCERWVGDWTNCNILTPSTFVFCSSTFSFCWATQSEVLRAHSPLLVARSLYSILYPTNWLQLTEFPVAPGYIIVCRLPASCERRTCTQFYPPTVKVMPWYLRPDAPVPWLTAWSMVNMLQMFVLFCERTYQSYFSPLRGIPRHNRNPKKTRNTDDSLGSGTKLLLPSQLLGFQHEERETLNFYYADYSMWPDNARRTA